MHARCAVAAQPPHDDCACGVHAWHEPVPYTATNPTRELVAGAVVLWGRIAVHETGMRAEHARIVALARPLGAAKRTALEELAAALGVPDAIASMISVEVGISVALLGVVAGNLLHLDANADWLTFMRASC